MKHFSGLAAALACAAMVAVGTYGVSAKDNPPAAGGGEPRLLVIGHRGASGYLPEHTLEAYELAIAQGADYIEPDLVSTRDGVLIARHEVNITGTTDVGSRPEFAGRRTTKVIDGISETGWFADDFTLAEIKTLRAIQRLPFRPQEFKGLYKIPTFAEVVELARRARTRYGRAIGVYPETKHPTYHASVGLALEQPLLHVLSSAGWNRAGAPVFIQSFEVSNLQQLNRMTAVRLVQLIDANDVRPDGTIDSVGYGPYDFHVNGDPRTYADLATPDGLAEIAEYADGVGPWKRYIVSAAGTDMNGDGVVSDPERTTLPPSSFVDDAHDAGLFVHTWTFRNESRYLASDYGENPVEEYLQFYCVGVDGLFSDFPDTAVTARALLRLQRDVCSRLD
jgi:glycerophosphoryl diester phosphodiesterase